MLKVVGASWVKTRISTYILVGAGLLAIGFLFVAQMERPQYDGTYCATVFYTQQTGFNVEYLKQQKNLNDIPKGVARTCYKDSIEENGWSQIEIETQGSYPDWIQAFAAGILEGSLTWSKIYQQWTNTVSSPCDRDEASQNFCTWLRDMLSENAKIVKEMGDARAKHDHYWHQIRLFYYQLEGLENGFKKGTKRSRSDCEIPSEDFLIMNAAADMQDLKIFYENFVLHQENSSDEVNFFQIPSATMLIKINRNEQEDRTRVFFGHSSAGSYSSMLRVLKRYKFRYHSTADILATIVPAVEITFTGYPGILASSDDFYHLRGKHLNSIVGGVAIKNQNVKLWQQTDLDDSIILSARVMAANRLSQSRRKWARIMSRNPITGNKQWLVVDLKKISETLFDLKESMKEMTTEISNVNEHSSSSLTTITTTESNSRPDSDKDFVNLSQKGCVWIVEQLPGRLHAEDMTKKLLHDSNFWYANGTPYFPDILEASDLTEDDELKQIDNNLQNLEDIEKFLRIESFRGDLLGDKSIPFGNIDMKLFSYNPKTGESNFHAISGPVFTQYSSVKVFETQSDGMEEDERVVMDPTKTAELEIITERRRVRDDIRALAMRKVNGPFRWSQAHQSLGDDIKHDGHPDKWNFDRVSPTWAWNE